MRKLLLRYFVPATLILILSNKCFSQFDSLHNIFYLKNLPPEGMLLDKGWKFSAGDNPEYAKPDYDDGKWEPINPALDVHDLPPIKQGIVWFRLHLVVDSNLLKEQLALLIQQSGASQIYLNGSLIYSFGVFDTDPAKVKAYDPLGEPVVFPLKKDGQQILAVRYALQPEVRYTAIFAPHNYVIKTSINTMDAANRNFVNSYILYLLLIFCTQVYSLFSLFFICHFSCFIVPKKRTCISASLHCSL